MGGPFDAAAALASGQRADGSGRAEVRRYLCLADESLARQDPPRDCAADSLARVPLSFRAFHRHSVQTGLLVSELRPAASVAALQWGHLCTSGRTRCAKQWICLPALEERSWPEAPTSSRACRPPRSRTSHRHLRHEEMKGIAIQPEFVRIGALTTWSELIRTPLPRCFDGLKAAAREIGSVQIQNRATLAGNLCNASPAADGVPPLLTLDAAVELTSPTGTANCRYRSSSLAIGRRAAIRRNPLKHPDSAYGRRCCVNFPQAGSTAIPCDLDCDGGGRHSTGLRRLGFECSHRGGFLFGGRPSVAET